MILSSAFGQTVTVQEVSVALKERGYFPLPATPVPESPPFYNLVLPAITPPVSILPVPYTPYTETTILPYTPPYIPDRPVLSISPAILDPVPVLNLQPSVTPAPVWEPIMAPAVLPPLLPSWSPVAPVVVLPEDPFDIPAVSPFVPVPDLPAFIIDEFPLFIPELPVSPPYVPVSPFDIPVVLPFAPDEIAPEKKAPWLIVLAVGAVLVLSKNGEAQRKREAG